MKYQAKYNPNTIVDKEFKAQKYGYDALQVDAFLDEIVDDYISIDQYVTKLEKDYDELIKTSKLYKTRLDQVELQNAVLNEKLGGIKNNESASLSNIDLLKRISSLEQALFKLGVDPSTIK